MPGVPAGPGVPVCPGGPDGPDAFQLSEASPRAHRRPAYRTPLRWRTQAVIEGELARAAA